MTTLRILLLTALTLVITALPASAHVRLLASNPEPGQALANPPQSIQLTFDGPLKAAPIITVTDPNGTPWAMGRPTAQNNGTTMVVTISADAQNGPAGKYTINYRVTGVDDHLIVGDVVFDVTAAFGQPQRPAQQEQKPQPQPAQPNHSGHSTTDSSGQPADTGTPVGLWIFGGAVLAGIAAVIGVRRARNKSEL